MPIRYDISYIIYVIYVSHVIWLDIGHVVPQLLDSKHFPRLLLEHRDLLTLKEIVGSKLGPG